MCAARKVYQRRGSTVFTLKGFWFDVGYGEVFDEDIDRRSDNEKDAPTGCDALGPVSLSRSYLLVIIIQPDSQKYNV